MNVYKAFSTAPGRKEVLQSDTCLVSSGLYQLAMTVSKFSLCLFHRYKDRAPTSAGPPFRGDTCHGLQLRLACTDLPVSRSHYITDVPLSKLPAATASPSFMILFSPSEDFRWIVFCFQTSSSTSKIY